MIKLPIVIGLFALLSVGCTTHNPKPEPLLQTAPRAMAPSLKLTPEATLGPVIPGLEQGAVPQGLAGPTPQGQVITSHYFDDERPSMLVVMDREAGTAGPTYYLMEPDGQYHAGHVGGVAVDASHVWIASDAHLYRGDLQDMAANTAGGDLQLRAKITTEATYEVAFCSVYDGLVWAGEFALDDKYPTDSTHHLEARDGSPRRGWVSAYRPESDFRRPEKVLSIPDRTQGMVATDDYIYLSISYGRRAPSAIEVYRNPLADPPHRIVSTSKGDEVPLWFLDGKNRVRSTALPPMSQNVIIVDNQLAVMFESGASKFRPFGKKPVDNILLLPLQAQ